MISSIDLLIKIIFNANAFRVPNNKHVHIHRTQRIPVLLLLFFYIILNFDHKTENKAVFRKRRQY